MSWTNRILLAVFIAAALAYFPAGEADRREHSFRGARDRDELRAQNEALSREIRALQAEVDALRGANGVDVLIGAVGAVDRDGLARVARQDLNMIRSDEYVFELVEEDAASAAAGPAGGSSQR